jgi:hypothetical protein
MLSMLSKSDDTHDLLRRRVISFDDATAAFPTARAVRQLMPKLDSEAIGFRATSELWLDMALS